MTNAEGGPADAEMLAGNTVIRGTAHLKRRMAAAIALGMASMLLLYVFSLTMGAYSLSFAGAWDAMVEIIKNGGPQSTDAKVLFFSRMPRSLCVIMVGAGLAAAGAVMQALIRNPLVDPYITGISSGASFGVLLFTIGGASLGALVNANYVIPVVAVIGAIAAFMLTMTVAEISGGRAMSYVLGGAVITMGLSAGTTLITSFNIDELHSVSIWLFGSFADLRWEQAGIIFFPILLVLLFLLCNARSLNKMLLGEEQAHSLGMNARTYKRNMMIVVAALTALCVAFCGVIGFVGLIVPHLTRMIVGGDHRMLLPTAMIVGANILLAADIFCKSALSYVELPIGAIISVVGVPLFIYIMAKEGRKYAM
ncbi:MAG: iron ABC transporter permease [Candidatus Methanoplasma sp.]|jgi:iron complex transport system permease protein|nr:iron ABC transporter permease [Candidatus Methanoplasma sp.]